MCIQAVSQSTELLKRNDKYIRNYTIIFRGDAILLRVNEIVLRGDAIL